MAQRNDETSSRFALGLICPRCQYDLRGGTEACRCPECGWAYKQNVFGVRAWRGAGRSTLLSSCGTLLGAAALIGLSYFPFRAQWPGLLCFWPLGVAMLVSGFAFGYEVIAQHVRRWAGADNGTIYGTQRSLAYWQNGSFTEAVRWKNVEGFQLEPQRDGWRLRVFRQHPEAALDVLLPIGVESARALRRVMDERITTARREVEAAIDRAPVPPNPALEYCPWCGVELDDARVAADCPQCE